MKLSPMVKRKHFTAWLSCSLDLFVALWGVALSVAVTNAPAGLSSISGALGIRITLGNLALLGAFVSLWSLIHHLFELHAAPRLHSRGVLALRCIGASALGTMFLLIFPLTGHVKSFVRSEMTYFLGTSLASVCGRFAFRLWMRDRAAVRVTRALVVGSGPLARQATELIKSQSHALQIVGFVDSVDRVHEFGANDFPFFGDLADLESLLMKTAVDEVVIALPLRSCYDQIQSTISVCERVGVPASYAYEPFRHTLGYSRPNDGPVNFMSWRPSRDVESNTGKRALDVLGASIGLILSAPLMLVIAVLLKLTSRGPILFVQERFGLNKHHFRMYKFRTMIVGAEQKQKDLEAQNEASGPVFKMKNDPRVTPIGRILRKLSLDELPQFFNVLLGNMSLVGPRPLPHRDVNKFSEASLMRRFSVKPGLTCLWQISGRSNTGFEEWVNLDLEYIDNWSPILDLKILAQTVPVVVRGQGAM